MAEKIIYTNAEKYEEDVLKAEKVVVDFYSTECPPCEALAAKFEPLSELYGDDIKFVKIFRQENRDLAESLGIKSSPTLLFYEHGKLVGETLSGAVKRKDIEKNLHLLLPEERVTQIQESIERKTTSCDLLILGGGPAGLTAAIYAAQAQVDTILIDKGLPGGQVSTTHQVSNYPGFIDPQPGFMLMHYMSEQAVAAGVKYRVAVDLTKADLNNKEFEIDGVETIKAKKVILATGSSPNPLGIPGEKEFKGKGISYCATCDAKYYEGKHVIVIGGGNSAIEESLFIAKFASKITVVHQFDTLQANKQAQEKAFAEPKIEFVFEHEPREFSKNDDGTMSVLIESVKDNTTRTMTVDGVFVFAGMRPNLEDLKGEFELDQWGYLKVDQFMKTSIPDIYAVGDLSSKPFRQITVATSEGTIAAMAAAKELS